MDTLAIILGIAFLAVLSPATQAEPMPGGFSDVPATNAWITEAARFAVEAQGKAGDQNE